MKPESFYEILKAKLDEVKEKTLSTLIAEDKDYHQIVDRLNLAEKNYLALSLTDEQKTIISHFISLNDAYTLECNTLNYLAGLIDAQKIGMLFPSSQSDSEDNSKAIRNMYHDILHPCSIQCETPETLSFWKQFDEEGQKLQATLSPDQSTAFKILSEKVIEGVGYNMADSFVYGFQLGSKMLMTLLK